MERRQALRILGGGAILAATVPMASCSSKMPKEAIAAWNKPEQEADLRRWILAHAILAPHSHNLQSWLVDLREPDVITLRMDLKRLLPETDPLSRQMVMSQGTFLELLDLAARQRGYRAKTTVFPEGEFGPNAPDARPTARIQLIADTTIQPDPLFAHIFNRHTNRSAYEMRLPDNEAVKTIEASTAGFPVRTGFTSADNATALAAHRNIAMEAFRIELTTARTLLESYKVLRVGPKEIAEHRDGLSLNSPMVRLLTAVGLFDRSQPSPPESRAIKGQLVEFNEKIAATPSFFWMITDANDRTTQLQAGRAYVRAQLAATAHGLAMHPLQQALQEYPEQAEQHAAIHTLLGAKRPDQTVQMWARFGYAPPVEPAPRRGVDAHIVRS